MNNRLSENTIRRAFAGVGFKTHDGFDGMVLHRPDQPTGSNLILKFRPTMYISDGRWTERPNVHIVSYWTWPTSLKELKLMVVDVVSIYTRLCGTKFTFREALNSRKTLGFRKTTDLGQ